MTTACKPEIFGASLNEVAERARSLSPKLLDKLNLLLIPEGTPGLPPSEQFCNAICDSLRLTFPLSTFSIDLPTPGSLAQRTRYVCIAIDSSRPEKIRDTIKKELWPVRRASSSSYTIQEILSGKSGKGARAFRLEDYVVFIPFKEPKNGDVRTHSFQHRPTFYRYRVALPRTRQSPTPVSEYLHALFTSCPNHLFNQSTFRASAVKEGQLDLEIPVEEVATHEILVLARDSRDFQVVKSRHENLQKFFLEEDAKTIACEVPVWVESWEFKEYRNILGTTETLTGHIDVLRCEDSQTLGVWDYKPGAADERSAGIQVYLYALMLAIRTGLPIERFNCGYFDEDNAYTFSPSSVRLSYEQ